MFCRHCGKQLVDSAVMCTGCGAQPRAGRNFCWQCGKNTFPQQVVCTACGVSLTHTVGGVVLSGPGKNKVLAGVLNLLPLIGIPGGIGRLYLGYIGVGVAQLLLSFVCIGAIWSIIDGILILTGSETRDADGNPLT